jgi:hypothetical protein
VHFCASLWSQQRVLNSAEGAWGYVVSQTLGSSLTPPSEQTHPQNSRYTSRCPSVVVWTPCSGVEWVSSEPASGHAATTRKQPANLGTESAEDSLTAFIDYTPTVRPPPKRC